VNVLVTGGAGFIGSHLVEALLARGDRVRVLDDLSAGNREAVSDEAELVVGDLADEETARRAVGAMDAVVHLGAHRSVVRSIDSPLATDRVNVHGTLLLLQLSRELGVRRFVAASSSSVYGGAEQLPTPESAPSMPRSPYAVSKLAAEHYSRVFTELFGVETVNLRYFNVYGPRQSPHSIYAPVVPLFIQAMRAGEPCTVHGDGLQSRDFTYVGDAVAATLGALDAPAERCAGNAYNVAGGQVHTLLDLLRILEDVLGVLAKVEHTEPRAGDVRHTSASIEAARQDLGYEPSVSFEDGLRRAAEWFRLHG